VLKPGRELWIYEGDKISSTTSVGGKVKPLAPCCKILWHVKRPLRYGRDIDR
jgi:hypothetical protein